jgi:putative nucleotidyltransferase with HDIG domain
MIKKITIEQLTLGLYVHDLNCGWMDHGFLRNRFLIKTSSQLEKIQALGIRELYIDTSKGHDVRSAPTESEVTQKLERSLSHMADQTVSEQAPTTSTLAQERLHAKRIHGEAIKVVSTLMEDVRLGQQIDVERASPVISSMVDSIFRNRNALLGLTRIRNMDQYTFEHSVNVAVLMVSFARALELEQSVIEHIGLGALLHDIGKIRVPNEILNKPGRLTDDEFVIMRKHVVYSHDILARVPGLPQPALAVAAEHHERIDGTGYPHGLQQTAISYYGQMAAVVDVYDAITSDRVYHRGLEPHKALRKLLEWSQYHFTTELVQQFIRCVGIYPIGTLVKLKSQRLGVVVAAGQDGPLYPIVRIIMDARHRRYLQIQDVNLYHDHQQHGDCIVNVELPQQWAIDLQSVLNMPPP